MENLSTKKVIVGVTIIVCFFIYIFLIRSPAQKDELDLELDKGMSNPTLRFMAVALMNREIPCLESISFNIDNGTEDDISMQDICNMLLEYKEQELIG